MSDRQSARADLVTGAALFALSVGITYGAWSMDRLEARNIHPLSAPGLLPGILGLALALCSVLLIVKALRGRGMAAIQVAPDEGGIAPANPGASFRLVSAALICLVYSLGLIGRIPYWLATALFVTFFVAFFEWESGATPRQRAVNLAWALFLGLAAAFAVSYVFRELFLVRLP